MSNLFVVTTETALDAVKNWLAPIDMHGDLEFSLTRVVHAMLDIETWDWSMDEDALEVGLKKIFERDVEISEGTETIGDEEFDDWTIFVDVTKR